NMGAMLHLIEPLGFSLAHKQLRRAGMDYQDIAHVQRHVNWEAFCTWLGQRRMFALTTKGQTSYHQVAYQAADVLLFGPETRGLPQAIYTACPQSSMCICPWRLTAEV